MIASLRGAVLGIDGSIAILDVAGVGYAVQLTPQHAHSLRVGHETSIRTALIVRDDEFSLFGFEDADSRAVFDQLRTVSGVGPKSAMGVLSAMTPAQIAQAVADDDHSAFRKVSGIGPKTAKLITVTLAGKLDAFVAPTAPEQVPALDGTIAASVISALIGLGWPERVAAQAVADAADHADDAERAGVQSLLRIALSRLGPVAREQR
ncbi:Holliday junction branch migration protein RuvA [Ruicaihuangia caeni]|uniref:Holliday junction branch migration complex subunit RuvA n=1 Tax=Ruicaihuangia caeni TaxID=3042517 RepID=A0AAW6T2P6_9MICO|nr:Holliday junction branch migration protein RuvA [Klugiella sp. YN-L-19]MDI2098047.1 Holliday junction branch migration protein RuvA [Klugiella sp. YN-L-19]